MNKTMLPHDRDSAPLTMANLISALKNHFPELSTSILDLEEDDALKNDDGFEQFVFSIAFNPFLKKFLSDQSDSIVGQRLFLFLEAMAQSYDFRVKHILAVDICGSLSPEQLEIAKKYMGPKIAARSVSMWDREEFEKRMRDEFTNTFFSSKSHQGWGCLCGMKKAVQEWPTVKHVAMENCWGRRGKPVLDSLEQQLNFKFDLDTRSFIEEIGNIALGRYNIIITGNEESSNNGIGLSCGPWVNPLQEDQPTIGVIIMKYTDMTYVLLRDGSIKAYVSFDPFSSPLPPFDTDGVVEVYASLAHLVEEIIKDIHLMHTINQTSIKPNRSRLTVTQRDKYLGHGAHDIGYTVDTILPELSDIRVNHYFTDGIDDWNYVFTKQFNSILVAFLSYDQTNSMFGKRLFRFLEAEIVLGQGIANAVAVWIFAFLKPEQLEVAKKYMGPKAKEVLKDLEEYLEELGAKK